MTRIYLAVLATLFFATSAQAATLLHCASNNATGAQGARVNVSKNAKGQVQASLSLGKAGTGQLYSVSEIAPGIYQGAVKGKNKDKFRIKLFVSKVPTENSSVRGSISQVEVSYKDARQNSGVGYFKSTAGDSFVCGKKIGKLR